MNYNSYCFVYKHKVQVNRRWWLLNQFDNYNDVDYNNYQNDDDDVDDDNDHVDDDNDGGCNHNNYGDCSEAKMTAIRMTTTLKR